MTNDAVLHEIRKLLPGNRILTGSTLNDRYAHVWDSGRPLKTKALLLPISTGEISKVLEVCNAWKQPVVPHGGLTNLVGSAETNEREIAVSTEKMNKIEEINTENRSVTVQAGVLLENLQNVADRNGMYFPLNFGAKGSAQMGGIISTNAGGMRVLRYGMTRNLLLGLEAVLPDGTVIDSMKKIIKDNSGYDLKQLFIGSEGTLGIVTRAVFKLLEKPKGSCGAIIGLSSFKNVVELLKFLDRGLGGTLSAFEILWSNYYKDITEHENGPARTIDTDHPFYVLMDTQGVSTARESEKLSELLYEATEKGIIENAVLAEKTKDVKNLWKLREEVDLIADKCQNKQNFDISLPISKIDETIKTIHEGLDKIDEIELYYTFGHVADGNIHLVIGKSTESDELKNRINRVVYTPLKSIGGSVSAEHGIGLDKKNYLNISRTAHEIRLMKLLKNTIDPNGILNPNKIL